MSLFYCDSRKIANLNHKRWAIFVQAEISDISASLEVRNFLLKFLSNDSY